MRPKAPERFYQNVKTNLGKVANFSYFTAETDVLEGGGQHRRIIGFAPGNPDIHFKPIIYGDAYLSTSEPTTYVYARHTSKPSTFFPLLDDFLLANVPELSGRQFTMDLNVANEPLELQSPLPFTAKMPLQHDIRFCRVNLPLGDLTIEFGEPVVLSSEVRDKRMTTRLESPLLGCDFSKSTLYAKLMAQVHWASNRIPTDVLIKLMEEFIPQFVN